MSSKRLNQFILFSFLLKIFLAFLIPLFSDEAYYWIWSQHLQLSYFDHPAMVAWLIKLGTFFLPIHNPLSIRLFFVLLSTLTLITWTKLLKKKGISDVNVLYFLILVCLNPLLGIGSILATPDVPLVFFWSLSFYCLTEILNRTNLYWYSLLGVFLGLGFCSKYHIVLLVLSGMIYLLLDRNYKKINPFGVILTLISGLVFSLPVLIWNYQNDWASFLFQLKHGFGRTNYKFEWTWGYLLGQMLLISPFIFFSLFSQFKKIFSSVDQIFSVTQILFFLTSSFKSVVEANWPITSHLHAISYSIEKPDRFFKRTIYYWIIIYLLIGAILMIPNQREKIFISQKNSASISSLTEAVQNLNPLYGPTYQLSSLLSWNLNRPVPKLNGLSRFDFFDTLPESVPSQKEFYVLRDIHSGWPKYDYSFHVEKVQSFQDLELELFRVIRSDEMNE